MSATGTYLYAITRPAPELLVTGPLDRLAGIGGATVRVLLDDGLCAVVSSVDLDEWGDGFGATANNRNLEDLAWVERVAREHDAVVQGVAAVTTTIPLRLGTVYRDDASARRRLEELRVRALATLEVLTDRQEWGVKLYDVPQRPVPAAAGAARPASGLEYLRQRRAELDRRTVDAAGAAEDAEAVFERLRTLCVAACRHRLQDPALSGVRHPMLLNAAFLIDRHRTDEFRAEVETLAAARADDAVVLTGPWPAYSFATLDDA